MLESTPPLKDGARRFELSADAFVLGSWFTMLILALLLMRPPSAPPESPVQIVEAERAHPASSPASQVNPDFYPWIAPGRLPPAAESQPVWTPPKKVRTGGFLTRLGTPLRDQIFRASDHGNQDSFYGGDWVPENIQRKDGGAFLEVRRVAGQPLPYSAAEMQSGQTYSYGRYEAVMQPAAGSGLVTAFFTYTGPWFGDPHDEIDIEFVGTDTTKIHFNYFRNGRSIKPATFDLPFDAAAGPRLYAFEWRPDGVTWFVEGVPYYATEAGDPGVPVTAGKVMFSAWTGKKQMEAWHGPPLFRDGSGAQFNCVSFTPLGADTPSCSDSYVPGAVSAGRRAR